MAVDAVAKHDLASGQRLYIHLCFQAVHGPYGDLVPNAPPELATSPHHSTPNYEAMIWRSDLYLGMLVDVLQRRGMYDETLLVYASDNGGVTAGNNFPLRGEKHSNWEGALRVAAFVSGGFVPPHVRGTSSGLITHLVDWYPTFCNLAGVDPRDDPPVAPLAPDASAPFTNIYGEESFPPVDGVDIWPMLTAPERFENTSAHAQLVLSKEVLLMGRYKLVVSQPYMPIDLKVDELHHGWKLPNDTWVEPSAAQGLHACMGMDAPPSVSFYPLPSSAAFLFEGIEGAPEYERSWGWTNSPCLFDVLADPAEKTDLSAAHPGLVRQLWAALNASLLTMRDCSGWSYEGTSGAAIPGPRQPDGSASCSPPALLGACNASCARAYWEEGWAADGTCGSAQSASGEFSWPHCGVSGCAT